MWDLTSLVDVPAGWTLLDARGINDAGLITGMASDGAGRSRAYLAIPETSPSTQITSLITLIEGFNLPKGMETSFVQKLNSALAALGAGDAATACALLQDAANHARAQSGKALQEAEAQLIIDHVAAIRTAIGCP